MAGDKIFGTTLKTPAAQTLRQRVETGGALSFAGVCRSAQPFFAVLLQRIFPERSIVVVTEGVKSQENFHQDIETWLRINNPSEIDRGDSSLSKKATASPPALFYPAWETLPHEAKLPHADVISERLETLVALSSNEKQGGRQSTIIVTTGAALMQRTFAPGMIHARTRLLARGDRLDPLDLIEWLEDEGYEPEAQVTQKGEIASRGGILDIYPLTSPWPVRLEFFGDELDSLRYFDPLSQLSREVISSVTLPPAGEIGIMKQWMTSPPTSAESKQEPPKTGEEFRDSIRDDANSRVATLIDYLPENSLCLLCEPELLDEHAAIYSDQVPHGDPFHLEWHEALDRITERKIISLEIAEEAASRPEIDSSEEINLTGRPEHENANPPTSETQNPIVEYLGFADLEAFRPLGERAPDPQITEAQRREFFDQLHRWLRQSYDVHIFCNNDGECQRFWEIWQEYGFDNPIPQTNSKEPSSRKSPSAIQIKPTSHIGALSRGFLFDSGKIAVVTDAEIFGRYKVQRPRRLKSPHAIAARSALDIDFTELEEGDFVVHLQHGIGRYLGLKILPVGSGRKNVATSADTSESGQECLVIEYAPSGSDQAPPKLYVPVTEAHLVSKYVGAGKARPALNTLGGTRWAKAKAQAEEAVRDLAAELLAIQAARESQPGHAFVPDTPWQREFESAFFYEETPDQERAILETKKDMETARPMDRLICGDVGYGKTEVALRAAFKAVMDGRQVAVLVPTTILAQQHFNTFRERLADYPVRVEQLSRFCHRRDQTRIVQQLANGSVDIVIGTHRLLQGDIAFKELGLVVVDEEQRFGVLHKEKLKRLRTLVDVLTLSATPIPRTLYLALTGARDMSTIETPPQDRLPVETTVAQYDERLVRDAIQRELNREGQVFYLHNRVQDIENVAARIQSLVPKARIIVGHGQMESDQLEEVMTRFVNGEADVLVCTTIIESGIDIPNANTIIIDRADRFGLSDLYQLRGRVGRYKHQAYAYLLLPRHAALLSDVRKRISAIRQYSSLGSGFKIAMRDLEIRGAGNLLGPEQSGHITAVGFELYCQLLKQSVTSLKGEKPKPRVDIQVRLDFLALHPGEEQKPGAKAQRTGGTTRNSERAGRMSEQDIKVPRETAVHLSGDQAYDVENFDEEPRSATGRAAAFIPFQYVGDARQRIEIYRKLAQVSDKPSLDRLRKELRDRFGEPPRAMQLLLSVAELKYLASERRITEMETDGEKLMLTRNNDFITLAGKFPRLKKRDARSRILEIKKLLLAL